MPDSFTETTSQGWLSRIGQAFVGVIFGLLLFVAAFPLLWWNEGRAVKTARSLKEGASAVVSVGADPVDRGNEGKLVHVNGEATTTEVLADPSFPVSATALKLRRVVEMYQWHEEKKSQKRVKLGGREETTTTYTYDRRWDRSAVDSSSFHETSGHQNPGAFPFDSNEVTAGTVTLGGFTLSRDVTAKIDDYDALPVGQKELDALPGEQNLKASAGLFYRGDDPSAPKVGDVRVKFEVVKPQVVSIVAVQRGTSFEAFQARAGRSILLVEQGTVSAADMFKQAEQENMIITWLLRVGGLLAMFMGLALVLRPIRVLGDVVPIIGSIVGAGLGFVSFLVALVLSVVTIGLAWIAYRPLLGIGLLAVGAGGFFLLLKLRKKQPAKGLTVPPPIPT